MMSRIWKVLLLVLTTVAVVYAQSSVPSGDPYYKYVKDKNPKLHSWEVAEIINANKRYSEKYHIDMFWHLSKSGYESGFKSEIGNTFYGDRLEPCYGIERLQVKTVRGMHPEFSDTQLRNKLLHNYTFAIECAYRLDYANIVEAYRLGYRTVYSERVVGLIMYNAGLGNWKHYHYNMGRYLKKGGYYKHGGKLEDLTVKMLRQYGFNNREMYSLSYYMRILDEGDILKKYIANAAVPTPVPTPTVVQIEAVTPTK